jgi:hypothetical protein
MATAEEIADRYPAVAVADIYTVIGFLADENCNNQIVRTLPRRNPQIDIVVAQETELAGAKDPVLLEWAAARRQVILSRDANTLVAHAWSRVREAMRMAGVIVMRPRIPVRAAKEGILALASSSEAGEWEGTVYYLAG